MWHEWEDLLEEQRRVRVPPDADPEVPLLDALDVTPGEDGVLRHAGRLRSVLDAALGVAVGQESAALPDWFVQISGPEPNAAPAFARAGRERFLAHPGVEQPWELEDWLSRFEPDDGIRGWAWWDLTRAGESSSRIWINVEGEAHYSHLDLLWAAYVAGAERVGHPAAFRADEWRAEPALTA